MPTLDPNFELEEQLVLETLRTNPKSGPTELGQVLQQNGFRQQVRSASDAGAVVLKRLIQKKLVKRREHGAYDVIGEEMIGIPPSHGVTHSAYYELREIAASYARFLIKHQPTVAENPDLADYFRVIYGEVTGQMIVWEELSLRFATPHVQRKEA